MDDAGPQGSGNAFDAGVSVPGCWQGLQGSTVLEGARGERAPAGMLACSNWQVPGGRCDDSANRIDAAGDGRPQSPGMQAGRGQCNTTSAIAGSKQQFEGLSSPTAPRAK